MNRNIFLATMCVLLLAGVASAQGFGPGDGTGDCQFIDEDGDGFNDLAPDADGDGIPNGLDPDYVRPEDGTGSQMKHQYGKLAMEGGDGQGFGNAYAKMHAFAGENQGNGSGLAHAYGPGDGSGTGVGPADGTGFGPGDGTCDGTGDGTGDCDGSGVGQRGGRR